MKTLIAAAALLAVGASVASAQDGRWRRDFYPYEERHHQHCQDLARQVWAMERDVAAGRSSHNERITLINRKTELDRRCGGWRYRG